MILNRGIARVIQAGAVAAPVVLLVGLKMYVGEPKPAAAESTPAPAAAAATGRPATAERPWSVVGGSSSSSKGAGAVQTRSAAPAGEAPKSSQTDLLAGLRLTAVLGTNSGGLATINGRICRVGDEVRPGLKVVKIDSRSSSVELETEDGETLHLSADR